MFDDGTLQEFTKDCKFQCADLSRASDRLAQDLEYGYNFDDIDLISEELGIPWEKTKDSPFADSAIYLGFVWDLPTSTVALGELKKAKYIKEITCWQQRTKHTCNNVEKLYGKLLHACHITPSGRAYLTTLETMLGLFSIHPFVRHSSIKGLSEDLKWWTATLL